MIYLPTEDPRIFHTGWIQPYNMLCQIDHYFSPQGDKIIHLPAHRGQGFDLTVTRQYNIEDAYPQVLNANEIEDNSAAVFKKLQDYLDIHA